MPPARSVVGPLLDVMPAPHDDVTAVVDQVGAVGGPASSVGRVPAVDQLVLETVVAHRSTGFTMLAQVLAVVGGTLGWTIVTLVLAAAAVRLMRRATPFLLYLAATTGSVTLTVVGKDIFERARPPHRLALPPLAESPSFPSGHTLNTTVVMGVSVYVIALITHSRRATVWAGIGAGLFSLVMGLSRIYLAAHWFTDVLAGWLLALAWLAVVLTAHRVLLTRGRARAGSVESARQGRYDDA